MFAICNELFEGWSWDRICRFVAEVGYDAVELAPFTVAEDVRDLDAGDRRRLRTTAEEAGLSVIGLHWLLVKPAGLHLTSPDEAVRRRTREYLQALAEFCGDLGGKVMILGSPKQRSILDGLSRGQAAAWLWESLEPVGDTAAARGVTLCVEPLPAEDTNFLNTLEEVAHLVRRWNHPAIRLILDVKSMGAEAVPIPDLIRTYGSLAAHVHANDTNRRGPGDGETDFRPIFQALDAIGYRGAVSVEVFDYTPDPETIARKSLAYMKDVAGELR